ncbi:hypothetical protein L6216_01535 [Pseudomonas syringae pv. syringae]|uniref:hypothetical protein n=1 Tax=Pseudomonas syringae TaxID=317 RepID=UPI001F10125B|nr:hypothetical protein [Pseudomonas syringae]MCH5532852.1 hypothetical protein [Pseudomonas syringae pv. syringae]
MTSPFDQKLSRFLVLSQIFAMLAIPVVLAFVGFWVQRSLQEQQIKRDYVSLAVSLLLPKKEGEKETSSELREWATELLNESSPVKLSKEQSKSLRRNGLSLQVGDMLFFNAKKSAAYLGERRVIRKIDNGKVEYETVEGSAVVEKIGK